MGRRACAVFAFSVLMVAVRALPASAQPVLTASAAVDDSAGDNNQTLEPGESALLVVTINNGGDQDATNVAASLSTTTTNATVTDGGPKTLGTIVDEAQVVFGISIDSTYTCGSEATFDLSIASDQGPTNQQLTEDVPCPAPEVVIDGISIKDATTGDTLTGAGVGQTIDLTVRLINKGNADATGVTGHLAGPGVNITQGDATYGTISAGKTAEGTFIVTPNTCPSATSIALSLDIASDQGPNNDEVILPISCERLPIVLVGGTWDDRTTGNGDGWPQRGETGLVTLKIRNVGDITLSSVTATLAIDGADITGGPVSFGDVAAGAESVATTALTVHLPDDAAIEVGSGPDCEATSLINGVDFDSHHSEQTSVGTTFVDIVGIVRVASGDKTTDFQTAGGAVCAIAVTAVRDRGGPTVAATGGATRVDLLWLAFAIVACGAVLRRVSLVRL